MKNTITITGQVKGNQELSTQLGNCFLESVERLDNNQTIILTYTDAEEAEKAMIYAAIVIVEDWKEGDFNRDTMTLTYDASKAVLS